MVHHRILTSALFTGLFIAIILGLGGQVSAVSNIAPDNANDAADYPSAGAINDVYYMVADPGTNYKLDAPVNRVTFWSTTPSGNITVVDGNYCGRNEGGIDSTNDGAGGRGVPITIFTLFRTDINENQQPTPVDSKTGAYNCSNKNITLSYSGLNRSQIPGHGNASGQFYVGIIEAKLASSGTNDSINGFRYKMSAGNIIGYSQKNNNKFAQGQMWIVNPGGDTLSTQRQRFASPCTLSSKELRKIEWYDADIGQSNQPGNIPTILERYDAKTGALISSESFNMTGGQGQSGERSVWIHPNSKYVWTINNIGRRNGIQYKLPFDSATFHQQCGPPTIEKFSVDPDPNCHILRFRARTASGQPYNAQLYVNGSLEKTTKNIPNKEERTFDVSKWDDGNSYTFELKVTDTLNGKSTTSNPDINYAGCTPPPPPVTCPSLSKYPGGQVQVSLSNNAPSDAAPLPATSTTSSYNAQHMEYERKGIEVTGSNDISPSYIDASGTAQGGVVVDVVPSAAYDLAVSNFNQPSESSNATVDVDYTPYVDHCPYDYNQAQVEYKSHYEQQEWRATKFDHYECPAGGSLSGSTCIVTSSPTCPSGYTRSGSTCTKEYWGWPSCPTGYSLQSDGYCHNDSGPGYVAPSRTCNPGDSLPYGSTGKCRSQTSVSCPSGSYNSSTDDCRYSYAATPYYAYVKVGARESLYTSDTANGDVMEPCWDRRYEALPPTISKPTWGIDREDVRFMQFNGTMPVDYQRWPAESASNLSLRRPNKVLGIGVEYRAVVYRNDTASSSINLTSGESYGSCSNNKEISTTIDSPELPASKKFTGPDTDVLAILNDCWSARVSPGPLLAGDYVCVEMRIAKTKGRMGTLGNIKQSSGPVYGWTSAGSTPGDPSCTTRIVDRPYFTVAGGDIVSGVNYNFGGACTEPSAIMSAWNRATKSADTYYGSGQYGGSGTTLALYAQGVIEYVTTTDTAMVISASRNQSNAGNAMPPAGLTFANTSFSSLGNWTGGNPECTPRYRKASGTAITSGNITGLASGVYHSTGNLEINASTITSGQKVVIYSDESIHITGDIVYNLSSSHNDFKQLPSVRFIAKNIYIAPNVREVYASLIAEPDEATPGVDGEIYTCSSTTPFVAPSTADIIGGAPLSCRTNPLTLYGSLTARKIYFLRSIGSVRYSHTDKDYNIGGNPNIAEKIIYTPATWLSTPSSTSTDLEPYESQTNVPPLL